MAYDATEVWRILVDEDACPIGVADHSGTLVSVSRSFAAATATQVGDSVSALFSEAGGEMTPRVRAADREVSVHPFAGGQVVFLRKYTEVTGLESTAGATERSGGRSSQILLGVTRELHTPLNGIIGGLELLHETPLSRQQREFLEMARVSAERQRLLLEDVITLARIDAGKMAIVSRPIDLRAVVESAVAPLAAEAIEKRLDINVRFSPGCSHLVYGDGPRIRQIINHLIANAVTSTPSGRVDVSVTSQVHCPGWANVRVQVDDTGVGLAENRLRGAFEMPFVSSRSPARPFTARALGLALSKKLVEMMGGAIGASSRLGHGSTFWMTLELPVASGASASRADGTSPGPGAANGGGDAAGSGGTTPAADAEALTLGSVSAGRGPALDPTVVAELRSLATEADTEFLRSLFNSFLENTTLTIELLRRAAHAGDGRRLKQAAESLRVASDNLGARFLTEICREIEGLGHAESLEDADAWIDQLEREFSRVKGSLA